ncbi:4-hydroxy-4-methyl-2-oxoglutarate aldolase [Caballeronia megalochromosomata]|nr:4-hydroxy-4-methyl-2-oxoglutarate aldolase [Caballeronia megalochromosomata]
MSVTNEQIEALKQLGTATIHEAQGQKGAVDGALRPIDPSVRLAGRALTVDIRPSDNLAIHYSLTKAKPGDVLVIDAKGFIEAGPWGDLLTLAAQKLGIVGLVIDGSVRDANTIIEMGFPTFSRGLSIKGTNKNQPGKVNVPVTIGGVVVNPGDIVVGDRDGLVVVAQDEVEEVIRLSRAREDKENGIREGIAAGKSMVELLGVGDKLEKFGMV